jgi:Flp pilus assembly protein TadG
MTSSPRSVGTRLRDLARENRGVAAVEFAFLLPVMLIAFLGARDIQDGIAVSIKNAITARTITDLVTQYQSIRWDDMTTLLSASSEVIAPYSTANLTVTVSDVSIDKNTGIATISWSRSLPAGSERAIGSVVNLPAGMATKGTHLIWGEVSYGFTPSYGNFVNSIALLIGAQQGFSGLTLTNQIFMSPRKSPDVVLCASGQANCFTV